MAATQYKASPKNLKKAWWKESVVYQIYPSSFKDSNGDGWGDIKGITSKLDYLKDLGVDIVWCSPMFKSPQADMGYDIADYKLMDPIYGTNEDLDELFAELKKRGMKMMMDLVVNHTSDQHPWFLESKKSKDNPKRDWYIWKPSKGKDEQGQPIPPNNWAQILGDANSAWTYSAETDEFYLSLFTPEQPDLNWENPDVRAAVHDIMQFWIDKGACGFRMDVINLISKDPAFPDAPQNMPPGHKYQDGSASFVNGPRLHEFLQALHAEVLAQHDTITVGEMPGVSDADEILRTVGADAGELNMIFIFDLVDIDNAPGQPKLSLAPFSAADVARITTKWQTAMLARAGWNSLFVGNHDQPRAVSRFTDDGSGGRADDGSSSTAAHDIPGPALRARGAKLLALMQTTLSGTLYVYQGDELGMRNLPRSWDPAVDYRDIESRNFWAKSRALHGSGASGPGADAEDRDSPSLALAHARSILERKARDHARSPMHWDASANAGFCAEGVQPWMRVNEDYKEVNAESQQHAKEGEEDGGMSVWHFYQRALRSRRENSDVFVYGAYEQVGVESEPEKVFAFARWAVEEDGSPSVAGEGGAATRFLTVLNFSGEEVKWTVPKGHEVQRWVAGNYGPGNIEDIATEDEIVLRPWEGVLGMGKVE